MIEAAFVLPVFALLLCGSFDLVRTLYLAQIANAAARTGTHAALAAADPHTMDLASIEAAARASAAVDGTTASAARVCACGPQAPLSGCDTARCSGTARYIRVETGIPLRPMLRYPGVGPNYGIRGEAVVRIE